MEFTDGEFGVVLDKGTLDALFTDDSAETLERIDKVSSSAGNQRMKSESINQNDFRFDLSIQIDYCHCKKIMKFSIVINRYHI